jgi:hypothetical protein
VMRALDGRRVHAVTPVADLTSCAFSG